MAAALISQDQFETFTKRMAQDVGHVNPCLDPINTDIRADRWPMRHWLMERYGIVVFGFMGSIFRTVSKHAVTP